jgi:hypothetical protein
MAVVISQSLVLSPSEPVVPLRYPRLAVQRITGSVAASSAQVNFPAAVADTPLTYSAWRPTAVPATWQIDAGEAVSVDYLGIAGHDMGMAGASAQVQYSTDGVSWTDASDPYLPADTEPLLFLFASVSARYWRVRITGAIPSIAVIQIGLAHALPRGMRTGYAPGPWNRDEEYSNTVSIGGQILGRTLRRRGTAQRIEVADVEQSWMRANYPELQRLLRTNGVFWAWSPEGSPDEVVYGMTERAPSVQYSNYPAYASLSLRLRGL